MIKTPRTVLRLKADSHLDPPFVVENGGQYVSCADPSGKKLTKFLHLAHQFPYQRKAEEHAKALTDAYYPQTWSDPFTVAQMEVTRRGLVTGTTTEFHDDDAPSWDRCDRHTLALAESASWVQESDANDEQMHLHRYLLMSSPLWPLLVRLYDEERSAEIAEDEVPDLHKSDALAYFGARIFYAGITAGRRENGKRGKYGFLVLDNLSHPEGEDEKGGGR
jgi:hypothetical protein